MQNTNYENEMTYEMNENLFEETTAQEFDWLKDEINNNSLSSGLYEVNIPKKLNNNNKITVKTLCDNKVWSYKDNEVLISLIRKAQKENNLELEETYKSALFLVNQQMVAKIVHSKFPPNSFTKDDLFQEGLIGLGKALEKYDENAGKFITFATWWINSQISRFIYNNQAVRIPEYKHNSLKKVNDLKIKCHNNGDELTINTVMAECECDEIEAIDLMNGYNMMPASLNYERSSDHSRTCELVDDTSIKNSISSELICDRNILSEKLCSLVKSLLTPKEFEVFSLEISGYEKNKDIARIMNISVEEARKIHNAYKRKVQNKSSFLKDELIDFKDVVLGMC